MEAPQEGGGARLSGRPISAQLGLLERDGELAAVTALIDPSSDRGGVLVIEAPPGLGKTSLIAETKARARGAGMQVLSARGAELEQAFSYGVVRQLFEPFLRGLPGKERAELLAARPRSRRRSSTPSTSRPNARQMFRWQRSTASTG